MLRLSCVYTQRRSSEGAAERVIFCWSGVVMVLLVNVFGLWLYISARFYW